MGTIMTTVRDLRDVGVALLPGGQQLKITLLDMIGDFPINNSTPLEVISLSGVVSVIYVSPSGNVILMNGNYAPLSINSVDPSVTRVEYGDQVAAYSRYGQVNVVS